MKGNNFLGAVILNIKDANTIFQQLFYYFLFIHYRD